MPAKRRKNRRELRTKQLTARIPASMDEFLHKEAERKGISVSDLVYKEVLKHLDNKLIKCSQCGAILGDKRAIYRGKWVIFCDICGLNLNLDLTQHE